MLNYAINYVINQKGITCEHFPDETIILNLPRGNYYSLRGTGQVIWAQLEKKVSTSGLLLVLLNQYTVNDELAQHSLKAFLNQLEQEELIEKIISSQSAALPELAPNYVKHSFDEPILETYTDMQELLMLDPIHDADPEKGWPYKSST